MKIETHVIVKTVVWIFLLTFIVVIIYKCNHCEPPVDESVVHGPVYFERVFMNKPTSYTFIIDGVPEGIHSPNGAKFLYDVPKGKSKYYEYNMRCNEGRPTLKKLYIHVHSAGDIGAGSFRDGKAGMKPVHPID